MSFTSYYQFGVELNKGFKNKYCPVCWHEGRLRIAQDYGIGRLLNLCWSCSDYLEERGN
jgi:hypothetical protein